MLASASSSGEVRLWRRRGPLGGPPAAEAQRWQLDAVLPESAQPLTALRFGPVERGLCLAVASRDGCVRCAAPPEPGARLMCSLC